MAKNINKPMIELELIDSVILPVELTNRNDGRGHHWGRTSQEKKRLSSALIGYRNTEPYPFPVELIVTRILGFRQKLWDYDSGFRGNYKEIQDTLVNLGWFHDDSARWITSCVFKQDASQRNAGPCIKIAVYRSKEEIK